MSETVSTEAIAQAIVAAVRESGTLTGSRVADVIRRADPNFSPATHGAPTIKAFIEQHVPSVIVVARAGMDVVYGSKEPQASRQAQTFPGDSEIDFWRIWTSPASPFALAINNTSGAIRVIGRHESAREGEVKFQPPDSGTHLQIAQQFLSSIDGAAKERLGLQLASPREDWWRGWFDALRAARLLPQWHLYREQKLRACLEKALSDAAFDEEAAHRAADIVVQSRRRPPQRKPNAADVGVPHAGGTISARAVVIAAAQRMSDHELRSLMLPLGVVLDILGADGHE